MKAVIALALAGSALAGGYGAASSAPADPVVPSKAAYGGGDYSKPSSTPADPVVPSKAGYGGDYAPKSSSTPADPVVPSKDGYGSWPAKSSSTPAGPVTPSKDGYGSWPAKSSSATVSAKPSGKPTWGDDDDEEDCDEDDEDGSHSGSWSKSKASSATASAKPTWSKGSWGGAGDDEDCDTKTWEEAVTTTLVKPTSYVDSWGKTKPTDTTITVTSTRTNTATITKSKAASSFVAWATPAYFDTLACCKTVVTVTETVSAGYVKPSYTPKSYAIGEWDDDSSYAPKPTYSAPAWSAPAAPELPSKPAYTPVADYTPKASWAPSSSAPAPAAPSASKPAWSGNGPIVNNGDKWGMTYTPYTKDGQCKTADEVDADIAKIKSYGFTTVRLYATDGSVLVNVGASTKKYDLKIIVGVFVDKKGLQASWSQVDEIGAWGASGGWDNVVMVVVGNEAVFNGYCAAQELADYVASVKSYLSGKGYSGWVTTTEPVYIIEQNTCLCGAMDVAAANVQPFFTSSISASSAGDFVAGQLAQVEAACGKPAYNLECGWPSAGSSNGAAVPSPADQKTAILDIIAKVGKKTVIFSFDDDAWKDGGEFGVEKSFGCGDVFSGY